MKKHKKHTKQPENHQFPFQTSPGSNPKPYARNGLEWKFVVLCVFLWFLCAFHGFHVFYHGFVCCNYKTPSFFTSKVNNTYKSTGKPWKPWFSFFVIFLKSFPVGSGIHDLGQIAHCHDLVGTRLLKTDKLHPNTVWRLVDLGRSIFWSSFLYLGRWKTQKKLFGYM